MASEDACFNSPPAEFPNRGIAKGLAQSGKQTQALGVNCGRDHRNVERAFQSADCLRGGEPSQRACQAFTCELWFISDACKRGAELFEQGALVASERRAARAGAREIA